LIDILVTIIAPNEKTQKGLRMNKTLRTTLSTLLTTVLVITLLSCAAPPTGQTTTTTAQGKKRVVEVMRGTLSENVTVEGNLEMPRYYDLTFGSSDGEVKQVYVNEGDVVKAGQLLAKMDDAAQRLDIKIKNNVVQRKLSDLYETVPRLPQFQTIYNLMGVEEWDSNGNPVYYDPTVVGTNPYINYPAYYTNSTAINAFIWAREEIILAHQLFLSENQTLADSELIVAKADLEAVAMILEDAMNNPDSGLGNLAPYVPTDTPGLVSLQILMDQPAAVTLILELRKAVKAIRQSQSDIEKLRGLLQQGNKEETAALFDSLKAELTDIERVIYSNVNIIEKRMDDDVYGKEVGIKFYKAAEVNLDNAVKSNIGSQAMTDNLSIAAHYLQLCNGILGTNDYVLKHGLSLQNEQNYKVALASALVDLDTAKNNLLSTYCWALTDGMIVKVNAYRNKVLSKEEAVSAVTLVDTSYLEFWGTVDEIDSAKIKPGQTAVISVDAVPDRVFYGKVKSMSSAGSTSTTTTTGASSTASASSGTGGVIKFNVKIELEPTDVELKGKFTATADISISVTEDALLLPRAAISEADGKAYVNIEMDQRGATEKRLVKTGKKNLQYIQIVEGLKQGDSVVIEDKAVNVPVTTSPQGPPGGAPRR
jgi:multidrug efflux pump subunit AcrA (membrane-fusion protein)